MQGRKVLCIDTGGRGRKEKTSTAALWPGNRPWNQRLYGYQRWDSKRKYQQNTKNEGP